MMRRPKRGSHLGQINPVSRSSRFLHVPKVDQVQDDDGAEAVLDGLDKGDGHALVIPLPEDVSEVLICYPL